MNEPRWGRFAKAAVRETVASAATVRVRPAVRLRAGPLPAWVAFQLAQRRERRAPGVQSAAGAASRVDMRLFPAVAIVWATALAAVRLPWQVALTAGLAVFAAGMAVVAVLVAGNGGRRRGRPHAAVGVLLALVCAGAVLTGAGIKMGAVAAAPISAAIKTGEAITATLRVEQTPRPMAGNNSGAASQRVIFEAVIMRGSSRGRTFAANTAVTVVAEQEWSTLVSGDVIATAGKLSPTGSGAKIAAYFTPAMRPVLDQVASAKNKKNALYAIRTGWIHAANRAWRPVSPEVAGLLPGMVMGERGGIPPELDDAMKVVGLTHLTAVSGENCTLVLTGLLLAARSVRAPRAVAGIMGVLGLAGFVLVVGPDASVLRAALMGAIGCAAMLGGRPKRVGTLLSMSILILLILDPWLGADFAFVLSVLATFGLLIVGRPCAAWLEAWLPWWLAQAMAIPLAAQLFCAPVIVLLQPRLTIFAIPANTVVAPVIALVTVAGTLGMVVSPLLPGLALPCAYAAGAGSWWVVEAGSWLARLPGAVLPWPAGPLGVVLMAMGNAAVLAGLWASVNRQQLARLAAGFSAGRFAGWRRLLGFPVLACCAAAAAGAWTWAVVSG